jgi:hypothetical protein
MKTLHHVRRQQRARRVMVIRPTRVEANRQTLRDALDSPIQTKLRVGAPEDASEREADAVAERMLAMPEAAVQRKAAETTATAGGNEGLASGSGGQPLPGNERAFFEPRLGADLSGVRVHADTEAARLAAGLSARAFTTGRAVYFAEGQYQPQTRAGKFLLAHELTHVLQQQRGQAAPDGGGPVVQRYAEVSGQPYDRLSDDGKMAVKDHKRDAWAESANIVKSNAVLAGLTSKVKIEELSGNEISVSPPGKSAKAPKIKLKKFHMINRVGGGETELVDDCGWASQQILGAETAGYGSFVGVNKRGATQEFTSASKYEADDRKPGGLVSTTERMSGEIYIRIFQREFNKTLSRLDALKEWDKLPAKKKESLSKKYGINKYAVPQVGQSVTIGSERDMPGGTEGGYNFHFGFNLMASGHDYITLEDYDDSRVKYYFDMYGPESKKQSWAQASSNVNAVDVKFTVMVVQHPESLKGIINAAAVALENDPAAPKRARFLDKNTRVIILRKGVNWMKVEVKSGPRAGQSGWILNKFFTDN